MRRLAYLSKVMVVGCLIVGIFTLISCQESERLFQEGGGDWFIEGDAEWTFEDGELVGSCDTGGGFVMTRQAYKNLVLELEFYPDSTINSGVFIRCAKQELSAKSCYEINIWDKHPNQEFRTGAVVTQVEPFVKVNTLNRWNSYKIDSQGKVLKVWVNDTLTASFEQAALEKGFIALQAAGTGKIRFRNIRLRPLE